MNDDTRTYFSELAKFRWKKRETPPQPSTSTTQDLKRFGTAGGEIGGNVYSPTREAAFGKANATRWKYKHLRSIKARLP